MIKFLDLKQINGQYAEELKEVASEVIDSGWYLLGERVQAFEANLSSHAVRHNSLHGASVARAMIGNTAAIN